MARGTLGTRSLACSITRNTAGSITWSMAGGSTQSGTMAGSIIAHGCVAECITGGGSMKVSGSAAG